MNDRRLRLFFPPVLGTVIYLLLVITTNWAEPEKFNIYFLLLGIATMYICYESSRFAIRWVDRVRSHWKVWLKVPAQFLLAMAVCIVPGTLVYVVVKQLFIIYQPQNDIINIYHITSRILGLTATQFIVFSINIAVKYFQESKKRAVTNEQLKREQVQSQFALLKSQVDPHFLFNSLNVLHGLIREQSSHSEEFLMSLSDTLRYSLEEKPNELVTLAEELAVVNRYVFLQKKRFVNAFTFISALSKAQTQQIYILPLTILMLIENAIKHNHADEAAPLTVTLSIEGDYLLVKNQKALKKHTVSLGTGLSNLKERYHFFSEAPVTIEESKESYTVKVPLLYVE